MAWTNKTPEGQRFQSSVSGVFVGLTVTAGVANVMGAYTQLLASTNFHANGIILRASPGAGAHYLFDIAVGAAASEQIIIPKIYLRSYSVYIPISVPAGSRISIRCQSTGGGNTATAFCCMVGGTPADSSVQEVTHGNNTAGSCGTQVQSPASGQGAWVQFVAAAPFHISSVIVTPTNLGAGNIWVFDIGTGAGGSETMVVQTLGSRDSEFAQHIIPVDIPAGSRIAMRGGCGNNTATTQIGLTLIGHAEGSARSQKATVTSSLVTITGGTGNAKGGWAEMHSSLAQDVQGLNVRPRLTSNSYVLVDVGIGPAGNEKVIFSNFAYFGAYGAIHVPIPIKRGTRVAMRAQGP